MKLLNIQNLHIGSDHILHDLIPGRFLHHGGINFKKPNHRSHDVGCSCPDCDDQGRHIHADDYEVFIILQGKAVMQVDGREHPLKTGDVVIIEPGEDHHLVADVHDPCVNLYLHAADQRPDSQST